MPETDAPCLERGGSAFPALNSMIVQDGARIGPHALAERAGRFAAALRESGCARVALATDNAATVASALAGAAAADCQIVLLRSDFPVDGALSERWGVGALADEELGLRMLGADRDLAGEGFRILLATSGTTGPPKLAMHALDALMGRIRRARSGSGRGRWLLAYPPASFAGLQVMLTALASGDDLIAVSDAAAGPLAEAARTQRPTLASGTPTFWRSFLVALGARARDIPFERITLGGEIADQATLDRVKSAFAGAEIAHIYASTEAGALFAVKDGRAGFPAAWLERPVDGVGLRIRSGVLEVNSPRRMQRYVAGVGAPDTALTADGWLVTGDRVARRGDRVLFLGRADALINVGGFKVSPEEVEATLLEVRGVAEAHVFGARNPITGELVSADVVLDDPADEQKVRDALVRHARARLDAAQVPRVIRFVSGIETTRAGKKARRR